MKKVTKDLEKLGIVNVAKIYRNLTPSDYEIGRASCRERV